MNRIRRYLVRTSVAGLSSLLAFSIILICVPDTYAVPSEGSMALRGGTLIMVSTVAGSGAAGRRDAHGTKAEFNWPTGVGTDSDGNIYVADFSNNLVRRITPTGMVTTLAGGGKEGFRDGVGGDALFNGPDNISLDGAGNIFVADSDNARIRKVTPGGVVTTVAGTGVRSYGDGTVKTARFGYPTGVTVSESPTGTVLYVADRGTHTIRQVVPGKMVYTVAGSGFPGYIDGRGQVTHLNQPMSVAVAPDGSIYISDSANNMIRRLSLSGELTTVAGSITSGYRDGKGSDARFNWPTGIATDNLGNIYVCDSANNKIRRVTPGGVVSTIAGSIAPGSIDGEAYRSSFNFPTGIWVEGDNIYIADSGNNKIRLIELKPKKGSIRE